MNEENAAFVRALKAAGIEPGFREPWEGTRIVRLGDTGPTHGTSSKELHEAAAVVERLEQEGLDVNVQYFRDDHEAWVIAPWPEPEDPWVTNGGQDDEEDADGDGGDEHAEGDCA